MGAIITNVYYTIPSDNWEQQLYIFRRSAGEYYTIPSDNWEQQQSAFNSNLTSIIPYQAIIRKLDYTLDDNAMETLRYNCEIFMQ